MNLDTIYNGDCMGLLKEMPDNSVDCVVTSPPYFAMRDYNVPGQIGLEATLDDYIDKLTAVFTEVLRVMKDDATFWLNIGDCYATGTTAEHHESNNPGVGANNKDAQNSVARRGNPGGCKTKDLVGVPWLLAFSLRKAGFYLRQDIIWQKPNAMPESVKDRCVKSHEYIFLLTKSQRYYINYDNLREQANWGVSPRHFHRRGVKSGEGYEVEGDGSNDDGRRTIRDVWSICVEPGFDGAHHATYPVMLPRKCIMLGCKEGGVVLDPFIGSGTTAVAALRENKHFIGFELNPEYYEKACLRVNQEKAQLRLF